MAKFLSQTRARRAITVMQLRSNTRNIGARYVSLLRNEGKKKKSSKRYRAYNVTYTQKFGIIISEVLCAYDKMVIIYRKIRIR
jgi:hypothetical protein